MGQCMHVQVSKGDEVVDQKAASVRQAPALIYGMPPSQNANSPILLAMELKVGRMEYLDMMKGAHQQPDFLAVNPAGKMPGLKDGDVKIGESNAILRYLAIRYCPKLYPVDKPAVCYRIDFAMDAFVSKCYGAHVEVVYAAMGFVSAPQDQPAANRKYGESLAKWFQDHVSGKFVLGEELSIADYKVLPFLFAAIQPGVRSALGFTPADRIVKYCEDCCAAIGASAFMKEAGGFSIAEYIAMKTKDKSAVATPAVQVERPTCAVAGEAGEAGKVKIHGLPASMNTVGPVLLAMETKSGSMSPFADGMASLKKPEYLAVNPLGQMPGLEDGTVKGGESVAILRYLALKYGPQLYPVSTPATCARIDFAMDDFVGRVYEAHTACVYPVFGYAAYPEDKAAASKAYAEAMEKWASAHLRGKFVTGDSLSIADYKAVPFFFCAAQPALMKHMDLKTPARIVKYCEDFCAAVGASSLMKEAGGWALAEVIMQNTK